MPTNSDQRLTSLDALRGFDMACILGLGEAIRQLALATGTESGRAFAEQFTHVKWEGCHFHDLIFPLFVFIAGVSLAIALPRHAARSSKGAAARRLVWRCVVLFALGVIYGGGFAKGLDNVRWMGVLQRIALASVGAGLLSLWLGTRGIVAAIVALLAGYWALLTFVPVPGFGVREFAEGRNLTNYLDAHYLAGRKYDVTHDPEGLLSTLPAVGTALFGVLAGRWLLGSATPQRKVAGLAVAGVILLALGFAWSVQFPIIKKLWTSSYVLAAAGWSALFLAAFYSVIEIAQWWRWATPFVWIGLNPITLYLAANLCPPELLAERFTGPHAGAWAWLPHLVAFGLILLLARFLHQRRIYLRV